MPADTDVSSLCGKVFLVAGASGRLGSALTERLLGAGARLGLAAHAAHRVRELERRHPPDRVLAAMVAPGDGEAAAGLVKGVEDTFGPLDGLVSAAGAFVAAAVGEERAVDVERLLDANLRSAITLVRAVVPPMRRRGTGSIVLTGAWAAEEPVAGASVYVAAKAGLHGYGRALAAELGSAGIRVAVIAPREIRAAGESSAHGTTSLPDVVETIVRVLRGDVRGSGPVYPVGVEQQEE